MEIPAGLQASLKLTKHKNVFGRNSEKVDFYLNSSIHKQLISRQHADLLIYRGDEGQPVFILHDKSLNGTFVNDIKVSKVVQIRELDTITFGHVQGVSVKPGMYSEQAESEFRFVFEKVLINSTGNELNISAFPHFSTSPLFYSNQQQTVSEKKREFTTNISRNVELHGTKVFDASNSDTNNLDNKRNESLEGRLKDNITTGVNICKLDANVFYNEKSVDNLERSVKATGLTDTDGEVLNVASTAIQRAIILMDTDSEPFSISDDVGNHCHRKNISLTPGQLSEKRAVEESVADVTIRYPIRNNQKIYDEECPKTLSEPKNESFDYKNHLSVPRNTGVSTKLAALKSLENLNGSKSTTITQQKMLPKQMNKRKTEVKQSKKQLDAKKSKPGTYKNYSATSKSEIFVPEKCASIDCSCPKDNTISWVQCDDCDSWYHVTCMGCNYKVVREPTSFFHCGCT